MNKYLHRVLGIYLTRDAAEAARQELVRVGMPAERISMLLPGFATGETRADSDDVLNEMLRDAAYGTIVGVVAGAGGTIALTIAKAGLFIANPVMGTLIMLGWGASLGGFIGATEGARNHKGDVADLIRDALASGHVVLEAHTTSKALTAATRKVLSESMRDAADEMLVAH